MSPWSPKAAAGVLDPAAISFYRWVIAALALSPSACRSSLAPPGRHPPWLGKLLVLSCSAWCSTSASPTTPPTAPRPPTWGHRLPAAPAHPAHRGLLLWPEAGQAGAARHEPLPVRGALAAGSGQSLALLHSGINPGDGMMLLGRPAMPLYGLLIPPLATAVRPWLNLYLQILLAVLLLILVALSADSLAIPPGAGAWCCSPASPLHLRRLLLDARPRHPGGGSAPRSSWNLMPLCTALIAVITLGEPIHGYHLLGGGLILTGSCSPSSSRGCAVLCQKGLGRPAP